jgi:hypothetical protein
VSLSDLGSPGAGPTLPQIFLSYRRVDDEPPPRDPKGGYVRQLHRELIWELGQLGAPNAVFWLDRYMIYPGDEWSDKLLSALNKADLFVALLSRNYVESGWCKRELSTMAARIGSLAEDLRDGRIFRADKNLVPDEEIYDVLKGIQTVQFFEVDKSSEREVEYYYKGQVQDEKKYDAAVHELAFAIYRRLKELGVQMKRSIADLTASNGRTVFVAKPAPDTKEQYHRLVDDLQRRGYSVVPDPGKPLYEATGNETKATIVDGLAAAELSIHLLGESRGFRPDGLDEDIVPLQLACAADEAARRPAFCRLIWAPKALPTDGEAPETPPREPFKVLARFDKFLRSDEVVDDTAKRFEEFVFQRLGKKAQPTTTRTVHVHYADNDRSFGLQVLKTLKDMHYNPTIRPSDGSPEEREKAVRNLTRNAQRAVLCWTNASESALVNELSDTALVQWRAADRENRSILLLMGPPGSQAKSDALTTGFVPGEIAQVIDATSGVDFASLLTPYLD